MDNHNRLARVFGKDEYGFADLPRKVGRRTVARIVIAREERLCGFCFPHGIETPNSTRKKNFRSWKFYRRTQYRTKE